MACSRSILGKTLKTCLALVIVGSATVGSAMAATGEKSRHVIPDFTKGDTVPEGANHDWNLGPTGLRGWMYCDTLVTTDARQVLVTAVETGSPADGVVAVGDVILGVADKPFSHDPRTELGRAITAAETEAGGGKLSLSCWRAGKHQDVVVTLPVLGTYSVTAPFECPKSTRIVDQGLRVLAERIKQPDYAQHADPIPRALHALALVAGGDPAHVPLLKREAAWASGFSATSFQTWYYGYVMMFLSEYILSTGDESVLPGLRRLALEAANGQSAVGSWGHGFALPDGRLRGYGMMNSPGLALTIGLVLARDAGVKNPEVTRAIDACVRLERFYIGKGAIPYGDHPAWTETHEDNGKCGMAAILFNHLGESRGVDFFTRMALASHGNERDCGHTGNFFNLLWSLPAVAQAGPHASGAWMGEFGSWYFDLARRHDGGFHHQGPPEPKPDSYASWDATGAYLLAYSVPRKKIRLTGKASIMPPLDPPAVQAIIADGRGWTNKDRVSASQKLTESELFTRLGSWSPIVRERAATELAKRKDVPLPAIMKMLDAPSLDARIGACQALEMVRGAAAPAVPHLREALGHPDLWLRVKAADALAAIGEPAMPALPAMLERLAIGPTPEDPRAMEQRYLCSAVFSTMLANARSLDGVDREELRAAIVAGLHNQDGRARGEVSKIYRHVAFDDIKPLLPAIREAIVTPAPSGEMFADGVRLDGLRVLAAHRVEEGMTECTDYLLSQNPWASQIRTREILEILLEFGSQAGAVIPRLREAAATFEAGETDFPKALSLEKAAMVREAIAKIEASTEKPVLRRIE